MPAVPTNDDIKELLRATGARVTVPRITVLALLLHRQESLTHQEIQDLLADKALDSVTLYRVLDWLVDKELAHRIAGTDQVWRFHAGAGQHGHEHAHFQCTKCDIVTCIDDVRMPRAPKLPAGFHSTEIAYLIKGTCPNCSSK